VALSESLPSVLEGPAPGNGFHFPSGKICCGELNSFGGLCAASPGRVELKIQRDTNQAQVAIEMDSEFGNCVIDQN
jgi:hypothetical protein